MSDQELIHLRQVVARVEALRDALAKLSGWVGPWVHQLNMLEELNAILDGKPSLHPFLRGPEPTEESS